MIPEPGTSDFRRWALRWPRGLTGHSCRTHLRGETAIVLHFNDADPPQRFDRPARIVLVSDRPRPIQNASIEAQLSLSATRWWSRPPPLATLHTREAVISSFDFVTPGPVIAAIRHGVRLFHVFHSAGASYPAPAHTVLGLVAVRQLRRALDRIPGARALADRLLGFRLLPPPVTLRGSRRSAFQILRWARSRPAPRPVDPECLHVTHYIGSLGSGGAERQLTHVSTHGARVGQRHSVLTMLPLDEERAHYRAQLERAGVSTACIALRSRSRRLPQLRGADGAPLPAHLLGTLDRHGSAAYLIPTVERLLEHRPDVLHCWLDESNLVGALAGLVAEVPRIVLSTRNVSPMHFPRFDRPWFREAYRILSLSERVRFIANSTAGAADYARWSRIPLERFEVIPNGLSTDGLDPLDAEARATRREQLGIDATDFAVVAVFRLADEKRPFDFLEVLAQAAKRIPRLVALHLGPGELEAQVQQRAHELGLDEHLRFIGRVPDPGSYLGAADVSLLTSRKEGCPNVSLEAQALGVPMILTRSGGSPDTVLDGETGFVCEVGNIEEMVKRLATLAENEELRRRMGKRAADFVRQRFSMDRMLERTLALYPLPEEVSS